MPIDLPTLHVLLVGALGLAAAFLFWEGGFSVGRVRELRSAAAGYVVMAAGSALLPSPVGSPAFAEAALSPVLLVLGSGLVQRSAAAVIDRRPSAWLKAGVAGAAAFWLVLGTSLSAAIWSCAISLTLGPVSLATGAMLWRARRRTGYRSQPLAAAAFLVHGGLFTLRVPVLVLAAPDSRLHQAIAAATLAESIFFAVALPVLVATMTREERESRLFADSRTDCLTGLRNRRSFLESREAPTFGAGRTLLLVDLDHFKRVNDTHGHESGDEVLKLFARVAAAELPASALIARLGGEEFAALVPGDVVSGSGAARRLADRFTEASRRLDCTGGAPVTLSVGVAAVIGADPDGLDVALRVADRALYAAKAGGRDRVEIGESGVVVPLPSATPGTVPGPASIPVSPSAPRRARRPWSPAAAG